MTCSSFLTTTVVLLRVKSNGTSATYSYASLSSSMPLSAAYSSMAQSIWFVADLRFQLLMALKSSTFLLGLP